MKLAGSCHCKAITFTVQSSHPYPFNICYCSICRKTQGGGGFVVNLGADACTLVIQGQDNVSVYRAKLDDGDDAVSPAERRFCRLCSSSLWVWDQRWPDLLHPFASAIDTPLPVPPERTHLMLSSAASWAMPIVKSGDLYFDEYPEESIAQWHDRLGLTSS